MVVMLMPEDEKSEKMLDEVELQGFEVELSGFDDIELKRFDVELLPFMLLDDQDLEKIVTDLIKLGYITSTLPATTIVKDLRNKWKTEL